MKKYLLLFSLFTFHFSLFSVLQAQNLVPNPSFEDYIICPNNYYMLPIDWYSCSSNPDYFNACDSTNGFGVPANGFGYKQAVEGKGYCGFYVLDMLGYPSYYLTPYKEYLGCQLQTPLQIGQKYFVSFYVCLGSNAGIGMATNNIGLLFSTKSYQDDQPYDTIWGIPTNNFANIVDTNIITDRQNWTRIYGSIIADSAYQYILIGNFFDINHIDTILYSSTQIQQVAYYFLDMVCVSTDSLTCNFPNAISESNVVIDYVNIYPNPTFDKIILQISESYKQCKITITDLLGKPIKKQILEYPEKEILLNEIKSGIYFIKIEIDNKTITKKFILTKN